MAQIEKSAGDIKLANPQLFPALPNPPVSCAGGVLIHNFNLIVADDIIHITPEESLGVKCTIYCLQKRSVDGIV